MKVIMKGMMVIVAMVMATMSWASKDGPYVAIGITQSSYHADDSSSFVAIVEDERATGWRIEGGYIWDLGKPGGFQLGVAGALDNYGKVSNTERSGDRVEKVTLESNVVSALFVIDQVIASWVDFMFKVGPSLVSYDAEVCCGPKGNDIVDEQKIRGGGTAAIAFVFFPTENIGLEIGAQATAWYTGDLSEVEDSDQLYDYLDTRVAARSVTASFQYRF